MRKVASNSLTDGILRNNLESTANNNTYSLINPIKGKPAY